MSKTNTETSFLKYIKSDIMTNKNNKNANIRTTVE